MQTLTKIKSVDPTPSGASKITLQDGSIAGTTDKAVAASATHACVNGFPVEVTIAKKDGKLHVMAVEPTPPEELGGPGGETAERDLAFLVGELKTRIEVLELWAASHGLTGQLEIPGARA